MVVVSPLQYLNRQKRVWFVFVILGTFLGNGHIIWLLPYDSYDMTLIWLIWYDSYHMALIWLIWYGVWTYFWWFFLMTKHLKTWKIRDDEKSNISHLNLNFFRDRLGTLSCKLIFFDKFDIFISNLKHEGLEEGQDHDKNQRTHQLKKFYKLLFIIIK